MDGTLTIPNTATLQLKASTDSGDATLTGPLGAIWDSDGLSGFE
jgi:hypothetical protein